MADGLKEPSIHGLTDAGADPAVKEFIGTLDSYHREERKSKQDSSTYVVVLLNNKDIEVIRADEPYQFPTFVLEVSESTKKRSKWGVLSTSISKVIPVECDLKDLVGKRVHYSWTPGHKFWDGREKKEVEKPAWEVLKVEGLTASIPGQQALTATVQAKKLLDGKTIADFNKAAFADPIIRQDAQLQRAISEKVFVNSMIQTGEFVLDANGVYHLAAGKA